MCLNMLIIIMNENEKRIDVYKLWSDSRLTLKLRNIHCYSFKSKQT